MKFSIAFLLIFFVVSGCKPKTGAGDKGAIENTNTQTAAKFEDPQRVKTCALFFEDLKNNGLSVAMSLVNRNRYTDEEMNADYNEGVKKEIENIMLALKEWEIKCDTNHFKIATSVSIVLCITILKSFNIRLDREPEPVNSCTCAHMSFNVTDPEASPGLIDVAVLVPCRFLKLKNNSNLALIDSH